jgi:hypothetical protein
LLDRDEEPFIENLMKDFMSTTIGMIPFVKNIYGFFSNGFDVSHFTLDTLNDVLNSSKKMFDLIGKVVKGEARNTTDIMRPFRDSLYSIGMLTGLPFRNVNNLFSGVLSKFSPELAYKYNDLFYQMNYGTNLSSAVKKDDDKLAIGIINARSNDYGITDSSKKVSEELLRLYKNGENIIPKKTSSELKYNDETYSMTNAEQKRFERVYTQSTAELEKMLSNSSYKKMTDAEKGKAISNIYSLYYNKALQTIIEKPTEAVVVKAVPPVEYSLIKAYSTKAETDKDEQGNSINGSKKRKVIQYIVNQDMNTEQKLLMIYLSNYTITDKTLIGFTEKSAKLKVTSYIKNLNISTEEKIALAEEAGFTVENGKIL